MWVAYLTTTGSTVIPISDRSMVIHKWRTDGTVFINANGVGMQTSTEDILLAYAVLHHSRLFPSIPYPHPHPVRSPGVGELCSSEEEGESIADTPLYYADLGCGIGSTLLVVDYWLRPKTSVGTSFPPSS